MTSRRKRRRAPARPVPKGNNSRTSSPSTSSTGPTSMSTLLTHKVTTYQSPIKPFSGRNADGQPIIDLETWISQVDTHISTDASTLSDLEKLAESRKFIDLSKGDIGRFASATEYVELETWDGLKAYLRKVYAAIGDRDPISCMAKILSKWKSSNKSYKELQQPIFNQLMEFENVLMSSPDWTQTIDDESKMNTKDVKLLLHVALLLGTLPLNVIKGLTRKWKKKDGPYELDQEIEKHMEKRADWDAKALKPIMTVDQRKGQTYSKPSSNSERNYRSRNASKPRQGNFQQRDRCYNCNRRGHRAADCYAPSYCAYHRRSGGHRTGECRDRPNNRGRSQSRGRDSRRNSPSPEGQRQNEGSRNQVSDSSRESPTHIAYTQDLNTIGVINGQNRNKAQGAREVLPLEVFKVSPELLDGTQERDDRPMYLADTSQGRIIVFVDTGAPRNFMTIEVYQKYFNSIPLKRASTGSYGDLHGNPMETLGEITLKCNLGGRTMRFEVRIVKNVSFLGHLLIGIQTLRKYGIDVCRGGDFLTIRADNGRRNRINIYVPKEIKQVSSAEPVKGILKTKQDITLMVDEVTSLLDKNQEVAIRASRDIRLQPGESAWIECMVDPTLEGQDVLLLPEWSNITGISTTSSLHTVKLGKVRILLYNNRGDKMQIGKGTTVGLAEAYAHPLLEIKEESRYRPNRPEQYTPVSLFQSNDPKEREKAHRRGQIREFLREEDIPFDKEDLTKTLTEFQDVIALHGDTLGNTDLIQHRIAVSKNVRPIYIPAYRVAYSQREIIDKEVRRMEEQGIIEPTTSPWSFPLLVVPKKDKTNRLVVDFRHLNAVTQPDPYPMPSMKDLIATIGSKKIYSTVDLQQGFLQIPLAEESRPLTAFSTSHGRYHYRRMPFGLKSSPVTFVRLMDLVLGDLMNKGVFVYIDDLILCSNTVEEHIKLLKEVLTRLRKAGLKLKLSKCKFMQKKIDYLGHTLSEEGIQVNDLKVKAIRDYPVPCDKKAVKSFLGLSGFYRNYIKNYATTASPLTNLLKEDTPFVWTEEQQSAFEELKDKLSSPPVLAFPDFSQPFYVVTDASSIGIGACLMQLYGTRYRPIAYYSRKLRPAERNYSVTDQESLAVVESLKNFRYIVYGNKVTVFTDHMAVLELLKNPHTSGRRARWFVTIQDYDVELRHIPGSKNQVADALSRHGSDSNSEIASTPEGQIFVLHPQEVLTQEMFIRAQDQDPYIARAKEILRNRSSNQKSEELEKFLGCPLESLVFEDDIVCYKEKTRDELTSTPKTVIRRLVPPTIKNKILELMHDHPDRAHPGRDETIRRMKELFFWKHMYTDVKQYIASCNVCNSYKGNTVKAPLGTYPIPQSPFERVAVDILSGFQLTVRGNRHILVCVDALTRFVELIPLSGKTARECASALFDRVVCRYSAPKLIISDNGNEFNNALMNELCDTLDIQKINIMPYHPASNGLVERQNKKVLDTIRHTVGQEPNWDIRLPTIQAVLNSRYNESTKCQPLKALMGYSARMPQTWLSEPYQVTYNDDPIKVRLNNFKDIHKRVHEHLKLAQEKMNERHQRDIKTVDYQLGDEVYITNEPKLGVDHKLAVRFKGPYEVIELSDVKVKVKGLGEEEFWIHKDRTKKVHTMSHKKTAEGVNKASEPRVSEKKEIGRKVQFRSTHKDNPRYNLRSNRQ